MRSDYWDPLQVVVVAVVVAVSVPVVPVVVVPIRPRMATNDRKVASRPWSLEDSIAVAVVHPMVQSVLVTMFHLLLLHLHHYHHHLQFDETVKVDANPSSRERGTG